LRNYQQGAVLKQNIGCCCCWGTARNGQTYYLAPNLTEIQDVTTKMMRTTNSEIFHQPTTVIRN
jgi:hypothetical protein